MSLLKRFSDTLNKDMKVGIRLLVLILSGVLTGLTIAIPQIGFFEWITIIPAMIILIKRGSDPNVKLRTLYAEGLVFFYGFYLVCYHFFLSMYPLEFIDGVTKETAAAVVVISWFGLALLQSLMGGLVFLLAGLIFRGRVCQKIGILKPIVIAAAWAIFEWTQNFGWWGVPWGKLALGQTEYLVGIQNASWLGSYFITFAIVLVNCFIAYALLNAASLKTLRVSVILAASVLVFQYASGLIIWFTNDITEGEGVKITCAQGNISASKSWDFETVKQVERVCYEQTYAAAEAGAKIVLWPETALPFPDINDRRYTNPNETYDEMCRNLAKDAGVYILVGGYYNENEKTYNSLFCYTPEGDRLDTIYNKRRLVPFGEFIPMRSVIEALIPPLAEILITHGDMVQGDSPNVMDVDCDNIGCLICFDSIYDGLTLDTVREGAEIICLSTNDSWFSGSAALRIHASQAQLRSIESGRYITRCASTGISAIVSPRGEILEYVEADTEGIITYEVYKRDNKTAWYYVGNLFVYICIAFSFGLVAERVTCGILKKVKRT